MEVFPDADLFFFQFFNFFDKRLGMDYHSIAYNAGLSPVKYAGGNNMEDELFVFYYYCMSSIVSALIPGYNISAFCQKVNDFAFPFVTSLGANNHNICHYLLLTFL